MAFKTSISAAIPILWMITCEAFSSSNSRMTTTFSPSIDSPRIFSSPFRTSLKSKEDDNEEEEDPSTEEKPVSEDIPDETKSASATDILSSPTFLKKKLEVLKSDMEAAEKKTEETNEVYLANKAEWGSQIDDLGKEYNNVQDRFSQKNKEGTTTATIEVARKLLEVLDNYDRAFGSVTPETDAEKEIEASYKNTYDMVLKTFKDLGIKEVETVGKEFDYECHQAVMMRPDENYEEGIVCEELAKGYAMEDGKLIRAAMVSVAQ